MKFIVSAAACLALVAFLAPTPAAASPSYSGEKSCKGCHRNEHKAWAKTAHAKAFESLKGDDAKNPECVGCHTTGYSGSGPVNKKFEGVQCEACHGAGGDYRKVMMKKKDYTPEKAKAAGLVMPDEAVCKTCHNEKSPNFKGFNFAEMEPKIRHK